MKARTDGAQVEDLATRLAAYREENARLRMERNDAMRKCIELRAEIDALREELRAFARGKRQTGDADASETPATEDAHAEAEGPLAAEDLLASLAVFVVGGSEAWQRRAAARFPTFHMLGNEKNFDDAPLKSADVLVVNTNAVSHAATEKAKRAAKGAVLVMTSTNNLDIVQEKICREILS